MMLFQSVNEGEEVVLESVIVSTPAPKVFWYRNNVPVLESDGFQIKHYGDVFKLILKHVNVEHFAGEYKVRAENVAGECQSTCTVQVIENEKRKVPLQTDRHLGIAVSQLSLNAKETEKALTTFCLLLQPQILKPLIGLSCDVGDRIVLQAVVEANPTPTIQWFKNNQVIQSRSPHLVICRNGNEYNLIIQHAEVIIYYRHCFIKYSVTKGFSNNWSMSPPPCPQTVVLLFPLVQLRNYYVLKKGVIF